MVTDRLHCQKDDDEQVPTRPVSARWIMSQPAFALGAADARAGRTNGQWGDERGRVWATLTPRHVQLRRGGKITSEALAWFKSFGEDII